MCRRRFLTMNLSFHKLGEFLHCTLWIVVQILGPSILIAMFLVLVYPWAITVFIWVIYLSDRCTRRGFWKLRKGV